jgi:transposase
MQAPAPAPLIEIELPTVLSPQSGSCIYLCRSSDHPIVRSSIHLPLYRQAQVYAPQGIHFERSTLAGSVRQASRDQKFLLTRATMPVLRGRSKRGPCWSTATPATANPPSTATSRWRSAGRRCGATSRNLPSLVGAHHERALGALPNFMPSRRTFAAFAPRRGVSSGNRKSQPLANAFEHWLRAKLGLISQMASSVGRARRA